MMKTVYVKAPARLHLGMFDISGSLGRRFGGLGVAIAKPAVRLEASRSDKLTAEGPEAARVLEFARRYLDAASLQAGAHFRVEQAIPRHVGLGSGTKLGLAVAQALATLYDQSTDPYTLAQAVGRGHRSAIGLWTFAQGGFVVEGGHRPNSTLPAPLLLRYPMPTNWSCVLAIPDQFTGLNGQAEATAFEQLAVPADLAARIAHVVLMSLLPALVEGQLAEFGVALTQVQRLVGDCFSPVQGGQFSNSRSAELIEAFLAGGAAGAGQSSWGPTVYGLAADETQGQQLVSLAQKILAGQGVVDLVTFDNQGVQVESA
ncbi:MAG: beta-ribofuranosylaminobenzene 5'-phosphate synthase [Anaerolineae bacterium]